MKEIRVLLIGVGGYGMGYAREMLEHGAEKRASIAGVVDPYAASSPVYQALKDKGHDPIMQLVGYLISGDPTYITSYNNARALIRRLERDELLEEFIRFYVVEHDKK